jgi:hypothetical protein
MGPLHRGMATAGQIPATRVAGGEGRRWEMQGGNKPHLFEVLDGEGVDRGGLPTVAQSLRRVRVVVALQSGRGHGKRLCSFGVRWRRWWEGWFGQCGGGVVRPCAGGDSPELVLAATSSGASGGAFIGAREGMVAWA